MDNDILDILPSRFYGWIGSRALVVCQVRPVTSNQVKTQMWKKIFKNNDFEKWIRVVQLVSTNFFTETKSKSCAPYEFLKLSGETRFH